MALTLRLQKGTALTNKELDDNFIYLEGLIIDVQDDITDINAAIAALQVGFNTNLTGKQAYHPRLQAISQTTGTGFLIVSGNTVVPRLITGGTNIIITNPDGVSGNTIIDTGPTVLTTTGSQIVSNKTISGNNNNISNISIDSQNGRTQQIIGILPISSGGTNASTADAARTNLEVLRKPSGIGIVVKTGTDTAATRFMQVSGNGLSISTASGELGNPTIAINSSSANNPSTVVFRGADGTFSATKMIGDLEGTANLALQVVNGVYTTGSYNNPDWLVSISGAKISNGTVTNNKLANSTITINGKTVALGSSTTIGASDISGTPLNQPNTLVQRDAQGNFAANNITATLFEGMATSVRNGVYSNTVYQNPSWIGSLNGSKVTAIPNSSLVNSSITINGQSVSLGGQINVPENAGFTPFHRWVNESANRKPWFANYMTSPGGPFRYVTKTVNNKPYYDAEYIGPPTDILPNGTGGSYTNDSAYIIHVKVTYLNDESISAYGMGYAFVDNQLVALSSSPDPVSDPAFTQQYIRMVVTLEFMVPPGATYRVYFQDEPENHQQPGHWNWHWVEFKFDSSAIPAGTRVPEGLVGSLTRVAGYTGSQGASVIGYTGSLGYIGSRGTTGYTGSQGPIGPQGPLGPPGTGGGLGVAPQKWRNYSYGTRINDGLLHGAVDRYGDQVIYGSTREADYWLPREPSSKFLATLRYNDRLQNKPNITYTNTTGRPIQIIATHITTLTGAYTYYFWIDGFYIPYQSAILDLPSSSGVYVTSYYAGTRIYNWNVTVPNGSEYSLVIKTGLSTYSTVPASWFELS